MTECPEIEALIERQPGALEHASGCGACAAVQALEELRHERAGSRGDACVEAEVALAARSEGSLDADGEQALVAHLESCAECNEVAVRLLASAGALGAEVAIAEENRAQVRAEPRKSAPLGLALGFAASMLAAAALGALWMRDKARVVDAEAARAAPTAPAPALGLAPPSASAEVAPAPPPVPSAVRAPPPPKPPATDLVDPWASAQSAPPPAPSGVGYLTIVCVPSCDSIRAGGKNLGASPLVRAPLPAGAVNLELRRGQVRRYLSVRIAAGHTTARRVSMEDAPAVVDPWR